MSKETWLAEFYPKPAEEATGSWEEAVRHSLQKWKGATKKNLEKHSLKKVPFFYSEESCALCQKNFNCTGCPLDKVDAVICEGYSVIAPEPIIGSLEKALEWVLREGE